MQNAQVNAGGDDVASRTWDDSELGAHVIGHPAVHPETHKGVELHLSKRDALTYHLARVAPSAVGVWGFYARAARWQRVVLPTAPTTLR